MNKKVIQLVALVGLLALLLVGYLVLTANTEEPTVDDTATANTTYTVATVDQNTVNKISYTVGATEYIYSLREDKTGWTWHGDPALPLDNLYFAQIVTAFSALTSRVRMTEVTPTQLMDFGLAENAQRVSFVDGVSGARSYRIGAYNSYNGLRYFCEESDLTTVYMVDPTVADTLVHPPHDMIALPPLPTDITPAKIVSLTVTPPAGSTASPIVYTYYVGGKNADETDVWYGAVGGSEETLLREEDGKALTAALTTLAFSELISFDADDHAAFGLDNPWTMTIDYKVTQGFEDSQTGAVTKVDVPAAFTLLLGQVNDSGLCYATVPNSPLSCTIMNDIFPKLITGKLLGAE